MMESQSQIQQGDPAPASAPPFGSRRAAALALYTPPFSFVHGYIYDAKHNMVADQDGFEGAVETHIAARVRGWGRIGYKPDAEALQDEVGALIAEALTQLWLSPSPVRQGDEAPIDMILHCPKCHMQHVDMPDEPAIPGDPDFGEGVWVNPPHKSHLCRPEDGGCGHIWRPADVPTNGVAAIKTKGKADHRQGDEAVSPVDVKETK